MPARSTVFLWLSKHPEFSGMCAKAKEASADVLADEMLDIADDGSNDWIPICGEDGAIQACRGQWGSG
jgi:hypothetical protein